MGWVHVKFKCGQVVVWAESVQKPFVNLGGFGSDGTVAVKRAWTTLAAPMTLTTHPDAR